MQDEDGYDLPTTKVIDAPKLPSPCKKTSKSKTKSEKFHHNINVLLAGVAITVIIGAITAGVIVHVTSSSDRNPGKYLYRNLIK